MNLAVYRTSDAYLFEIQSTTIDFFVVYITTVSTHLHIKHADRGYILYFKSVELVGGELQNYPFAWPEFGGIFTFDIFW